MREHRIGLIIPSSNTTMETEYHQLNLPEITIHTARIRLREVTEKELTEMEEEATYEALKLKDAKVNIIAYGCTSGSLIKGPKHGDTLEKKIREATEIETIATSNAVIRAIKHLNIKKIAVITPYTKEINEYEKRFLEAHQIEVCKITGMNITNNTEIGKIDPEETYQLTLENTPKDVNGVFISCTNLKTMKIINKLEREIHRPAISSNTATLWNILNKLKIKTKIKEMGSLQTD